MENQHQPETPSFQQHKRDTAWQIIVPILIVTSIIIATAILTVLSATSSVSLWRDISLIWLLAPTLILALLPLVVLIAVIIGTSRLSKGIPRVSFQVQHFVFKGAEVIQRLLVGIVKPFIWVNQTKDSLKYKFKRRPRKNPS